jgi:quercetin dioxygenase-like cupin family protein
LRLRNDAPERRGRVGAAPGAADKLRGYEMRNLPRFAAAGLALFAMFQAGLGLGQQHAPTDYKLVGEDVLATIDLASEIDGVEGRELRLTRAQIEPGGHIGLHSHRGDPTVVYILGGVLTNHHDDGTTEEYRAGQVFTEYGPRSHWVENNGPVPVTFIAANIHRR